jgi:hypothetical protein
MTSPKDRGTYNELKNAPINTAPKFLGMEISSATDILEESGPVARTRT